MPSHTFQKSDVLHCVNSLEFCRLSRVDVVRRPKDYYKLTCTCARVLAFVQWINVIDNPTKLRGNIIYIEENECFEP